MSVDSVIHDTGYQRYAGPRLGRGYAVASLLVHGLRTSYGLGRPAKAKIFPWSVAAIVAGMAVIFAAIRAQTGEVVTTYVGFVDGASTLAILFVAIVGPELLSRDLGSGVLPLYFTRAVAPRDYVLAKVAAMVGGVWLLLGAPQLIMFLAAAFGSDGMGEVWNEVVDLVLGLLFAGMQALVYGTLALLVASLTGKRAFAAGGIVAAFLVTLPITAVLAFMPSETTKTLASVANPAGIVQGAGNWIFSDLDSLDVGSYGPVYGLAAVALVAACILLLLARYRKVATR